MDMDFSTKIFGDIFYKVQLDVMLPRKKLCKLDEYNQEWYRYENSTINPVLVIYEYCGNKIVTYSGIANSDYPENEYYMRSLEDKNKILEYDEYGTILGPKSWFDNLEKAEKVIADYKQEMLENERKF